MEKLLSSIQFKVFGVIFALTFVLVAILVTYFPARQIQSVREMMENKATTYAGLISDQVESGVAFDDRETVREVFGAASKDHDVDALVLYKSNGQALYSEGEFNGGAAPSYARVGALRLEVTRSFIRAFAPVVSKEGPTGTLVLELSTDRIEAERTRIERLAAIMGCGALAFGFLAAWAIGRSLATRLRKIASATQAVAAGDLLQGPLLDDSADEVGQLARAFNTMFSNIKALLDQIHQKNEKEKERLDVLVHQRTAELDARNKDMHLVLDHVAQGLFTIDQAGVVSPEYSRATEHLMGIPLAGATLWSYVAASDPAVALWTHLSWEAVVDKFLPLEVALEQMPQRLRRGDAHLRLEYRPILVAGELSKVLVVVSDVTSDIAKANADAEQSELVAMFERATKDKNGFVEFLAEAGRLVLLIGEASELSPEVRRSIHTLKGNCAIFGLESVAELCHSMEGCIAETGRLPGEAERRDLVERWRKMSARLTALVGDSNASRIELDDADYDGLMHSIVTGVPRAKLAHEVWLWRLEPASRRLDRIAHMARGLAARLGKPGVTVVTEPNALRLDTGRWAPFWSAFVHVVRNSLDHGIETPDERVARGKPGAGTLAIRTYIAGAEFVVEAADDGRGIDWDALAERGRALGLPYKEVSDLHQLLFRDGVSTKTHATEWSGRGIGMGALRAACQGLGGQIHVRSVRNEGTVIQFRFPASATGDSFVEPKVLGSVVPAA